MSEAGGVLVAEEGMYSKKTWLGGRLHSSSGLVSSCGPGFRVVSGVVCQVDSGCWKKMQLGFPPSNFFTFSTLQCKWGNSFLYLGPWVFTPSNPSR